MEKSNCEEKKKDYTHTKNKCENVKNQNTRLKMKFLSLNFISSILFCISNHIFFANKIHLVSEKRHF